jgi:hypothetical protein
MHTFSKVPSDSSPRNAERQGKVDSTLFNLQGQHVADARFSSRFVVLISHQTHRQILNNVRQAGVDLCTYLGSNGMML